MRQVIQLALNTIDHEITTLNKQIEDLIERLATAGMELTEQAEEVGEQLDIIQDLREANQRLVREARDSARVYSPWAK